MTTRARVRALVDRLPVGRSLALTVGRAVSRRLARRGQSARRSPAGQHAPPATFQVRPRPRRIEGAWPEPPPVETPLEVVNRAADAGAEPQRFDIELFEALNEEYASKPIVPTPRGLDATSATDRARRRLESVHESIDLSRKRVLEFGCAAGYEVWMMAHRFDADATGVDIDERRAWPHLRGERVTLVKTDIARDQPFPADHFDRVVSFSVFEHVTHPHASAEELFRIMRPGGLAWISANLYRGPMASHRYREIYFPWPHILFDDDVFREYYRRRGKPPNTAAWVNRLSWLDYESMFERIGFRIRSLRFTERPIDEAFYRRFESVLGRYPRWDLERDFFKVVLEKPRTR